MTTPKLSLPELSVSQASKEITHNQALAILDQLTQARVLDKDLATPPGSPANGDAYIVAASPTGAWAGKTGQIAYWLTAVNAWSFAVPLNGWLVYVNDENKHYRRESGSWVELATGGGGSSTIATQSASSSAGALDLSSTTAPVILVTLTENITSITLPAGVANQSIERRIVFTQGGAGTYAIPVTTGAWGSIVVDGGGAIQQMGTGVGTVGVYVLANDNNGTWRMYVDDSRRTSPYATAGGTANAITLSINHIPSRLTAYTQGDKVRARIGATNTGAATLAVDGLSAVNVVTVTGAALPAGYIRTDVDTEFTYNGSAWVASRERELGSNANGSFTRHADGTLECFTSMTETSGAVSADGVIYSSTTPTTWTLPAALISAGTAQAVVSAQVAGIIWFNGRLNSTTDVQVTKFTGRSTESTARVFRATVTGFWY